MIRLIVDNGPKTEQQYHAAAIREICRSSYVLGTDMLPYDHEYLPEKDVDEWVHECIRVSTIKLVV